MGKRGPPATPLRILEGRGSRRAKEKADTAKSPTPKRPPAPPAWLKADGKRAWRWLIDVLLEMGLYGNADRRAIERYCITYQRWRAALRDIAQHGETVWVTMATNGAQVEKNSPAVLREDAL